MIKTAKLNLAFLFLFCWTQGGLADIDAPKKALDSEETVDVLRSVIMQELGIVDPQGDAASGDPTTIKEGSSTEDTTVIIAEIIEGGLKFNIDTSKDKILTAELRWHSDSAHTVQLLRAHGAKQIPVAKFETKKGWVSVDMLDDVKLWSNPPSTGTGYILKVVCRSKKKSDCFDASLKPLLNLGYNKGGPVKRGIVCDKTVGHCCLREMRLDVREQMKWSWLLGPKIINFKYCYGTCDHEQLTLNTRIMRTLVKQTSCCVATKTDKLRVIHELNGKVKDRTLNGIQATECACTGVKEG